MKSCKTLLIVVALTMHGSALAATEYLRLEGTIDSNFITLPDGLVDGQFIYFDFLLDTAIDPEPDNNDFYFEQFLVEYIGGNYAVNARLAGASQDASNNIYRYIILQGSPFSIQEVISCEVIVVQDPRCESPLEFDWVVGSTAELLFGNFQDRIANLETTYRGSTPPPPIPVPAALWLMMSAFLGLFSFHKLKR